MKSPTLSKLVKKSIPCKTRSYFYYSLRGVITPQSYLYLTVRQIIFWSYYCSRMSCNFDDILKNTYRKTKSTRIKVPGIKLLSVRTNVTIVKQERTLILSSDFSKS